MSSRLQPGDDTISSEHLRWYRINNSGLMTPFATAQACAGHLAGIQAQMPTAAALALGFRLKSYSYREFSDSLYVGRSLVRTWGQRNTLHVYDAKEWPRYVSAFRERCSWAHNQFIKAGGTDGQYDALMVKLGEVLKADGPMNREELGQRIGYDIHSWGGVLIDGAYRGLVADAGGRTFGHGNQWHGRCKQPASDNGQAHAWLIAKYLHGYGPATTQDITHWLGGQVNTTRTALAKLDTCTVTCEGKSLHLMKVDRKRLINDRPPEGNWPVLTLYRFDPLLLAYRDKSWLVASDHHKQVWTTAGHVLGVILENGLAVGTWSYAKQKNSYRIQQERFNQRSKFAAKSMAGCEAFINAFFMGAN